MRFKGGSIRVHKWLEKGGFLLFLLGTGAMDSDRQMFPAILTLTGLMLLKRGGSNAHRRKSAAQVL